MGRSQDLGRTGPPAGPPADDTGCPILHVDMDAFYASVELRRRPELRSRPVIVGGGRRGVVLSATYEARAFGVRSAMPMGRAVGLCPEAVVVAPDMRRYAVASAGVMAVFRSVTPLVEPLSLDEAFLDVSGARRRLGRPGWIGEWIRARIADEQGITCSVGVAPTKFVAKLASSRCKPDGLLVVPVDGVRQFLQPLPVGALWGVGERTAAQLAGLGLRTVGDLAALPLPALARALGDGVAAHLHSLAHGEDPRTVVPVVRAATRRRPWPDRRRRRGTRPPGAARPPPRAGTSRTDGSRAWRRDRAPGSRRRPRRRPARPAAGPR